MIDIFEWKDKPNKFICYNESIKQFISPLIEKSKTIKIWITEIETTEDSPIEIVQSIQVLCLTAKEAIAVYDILNEDIIYSGDEIDYKETPEGYLINVSWGPEALLWTRDMICTN